jgi:hypothetical protein
MSALNTAYNNATPATPDRDWLHPNLRRDSKTSVYETVSQAHQGAAVSTRRVLALAGVSSLPGLVCRPQPNTKIDSQWIEYHSRLLQTLGRPVEKVLHTSSSYALVKRFC